MLSYLKSLLPQKIKHTYYISLCCIVKDENEYLEEWVNYHLKIGVQHFYLYDNGSTIPLSDTMQKLQLLKYASIISFPGNSKQYDAYQHCLKNYGNASQWMGFIDMDEFIVPKATHGNLPAFLNQYELYGGLGINWLIFGSGGHIKKTNRPQLESFILRSDGSFDVNRHIKSIVQPKYVKGIKNAHCFKYKKGKFCVNEKFTPIGDAFSDLSVDSIQLNHYFCRSLEEYEEKIKRGRADDASLLRSVELFHAFDRVSNKIEDTVILDISNKCTIKAV